MSRSDRWVNSAPEETGVDVDSDYIGKMDAEHERADDCLADDPDAGEAQFDRSADGNSGMDDRKMDDALVKHIVDFQRAASRACLSASSPGFL